ncbi:MAG: hemin uptake protein HemP [Pseudomonadota bacterium]
MTNVPHPAADFHGPKMDSYNARDLIKSGTQAAIVLDEQVYVLRITRAGKLILTK